MNKAISCALCLSVVATSSLATDARTLAFITDKAGSLASQGRFEEAFSEIEWLLRDDSYSTRARAAAVIKVYPAIATEQISRLTPLQLKLIGCKEGSRSAAKQTATKLIDQVAEFVDSHAVSNARARVEDAYGTEDGPFSELDCQQAQRAREAEEQIRKVEEQKKQDALIAADTASAAKSIRALEKLEFCAQYGTVLQGNRHLYGMVTDLPKLFETEAKRRGVRLDEKLVKAEQIRIGIDQCTLYASWGRPNSVNRLIGSWGTHAQLIYGDFGPYVYVSNGKVSSFQDQLR